MIEELKKHKTLDLMTFIHIAIYYDDSVNHNIDDAKKEELKKIAHTKITAQLERYLSSPLLISKERIQEIKVATGIVLDEALNKMLKTNSKDYSEVNVLAVIYSSLERLQGETPTLTDKGRKALEKASEEQMKRFLARKIGRWRPTRTVKGFTGKSD